MSIPVINFDIKPKSSRQVEMYPNILRAGLFGPSGSGKSNTLFTCLLYMRPFHNLYLCSKTSFQEKYKLLNELIGSYNKNRAGEKKKKINFHQVNSTNDLPEPEQVPCGSVIIFDDILTENQDKIANFFLRGRHRDISCFYLSQGYTKVPKKSCIRENFNYLILFRQDLVNLRQIYVEYVTDLTFEKFKHFCNMCWSDPYGFLVIDVENERCKYKNKFTLDPIV